MAGKKDRKPEKEKKGLLSVSIGGSGGKMRGKLPSKTTINLALPDEREIKPQIAVPAIILICLLAAVFGKIAVADRLISASRAAGEASKMRADLEAAYEEISYYSSVEDRYAHYTYSGMTEEEMERVDRVEVMELVEKAMRAGYSLKSWTVSGNTMTLNMTGNSLKELNRLSQVLEQEPIVEQCVIKTADRSEKKDAYTDVEAVYTIYLRYPETEAGEAAAEEEPAGTQMAEGGEPAGTQVAEGEQPAETRTAAEEEPAVTQTAEGGDAQ